MAIDLCRVGRAEPGKQDRVWFDSARSSTRWTRLWQPGTNGREETHRSSGVQGGYEDDAGDAKACRTKSCSKPKDWNACSSPATILTLTAMNLLACDVGCQYWGGPQPSKP
jgi:hypothetical protein